METPTPSYERSLPPAPCGDIRIEAIISNVCGQACYSAGCPNHCSKKSGHAGAHTCGNH